MIDAGSKFRDIVVRQSALGNVARRGHTRKKEQENSMTTVGQTKPYVIGKCRARRDPIVLKLPFSGRRGRCFRWTGQETAMRFPDTRRFEDNVHEVVLQESASWLACVLYILAIPPTRLGLQKRSAGTPTPAIPSSDMTTPGIPRTLPTSYYVMMTHASQLVRIIPLVCQQGIEVSINRNNPARIHHRLYPNFRSGPIRK